MSSSVFPASALAYHHSLPRSNSSSSLTLPPETLAAIIHEAYQSLSKKPQMPMLARFALVSKNFLFIVRPLLYTHLDLESWGSVDHYYDNYYSSWGRNTQLFTRDLTFADTVSRLTESLKRWPHLGALVKSLYYRVYVPSLNPDRDEEDEEDAAFDAELGCLEVILRSCRNLTKLEINSHDYVGYLAQMVLKSGIQLEELNFVASYDPPKNDDEEGEYSGHSISHYDQKHLRKLLCSQTTLKRVKLTNVDSAPIWSTNELPTFSLDELELNMVFSRDQDQDDGILDPYSMDSFLIGILSNSYASLKHLTIPLSRKDLFDAISPTPTFPSLTDLRVCWEDDERYEDQQRNLPIMDITYLLLQCPQLVTLSISGEVADPPAPTLQLFVHSLPSTLMEIIYEPIIVDLELERKLRRDLPKRVELYM